MQPIVIDDADDPRLDDYRQLHGRRRESDERFVVESVTAIERLLTSPYPVRSILLSESRWERLRPSLGSVDAPVYLAGHGVMATVAGFDIHRGAVASASRLPLADLDAVLATARRLVVLEGCNDHENLGTIARSARGLGMDALVLDPTSADPFYRRSVRVSMGELLHLPIVRCASWPGALRTIAAAGFEVWALTPSAGSDVRDLVPPERLALLAGTEGPGLTAAAFDAARRRVGIRMHAGVDSLNVGHALAVAMAVTTR